MSLFTRGRQASLYYSIDRNIGKQKVNISFNLFRWFYPGFWVTSMYDSWDWISEIEEVQQHMRGGCAVVWVGLLQSKVCFRVRADCASLPNSVLSDVNLQSLKLGHCGVFIPWKLTMLQIRALVYFRFQRAVVLLNIYQYTTQCVYVCACTHSGNLISWKLINFKDCSSSPTYWKNDQIQVLVAINLNTISFCFFIFYRGKLTVN